MNKLRFHSALGRGRSVTSSHRVDTVTLSLRQFHISAIRSQDEEPGVKQALPPSPRRERNQSITRLTQSLSEQASPRPLFRRVVHEGHSPIDARNLAAAPPTSAIRNLKPGQTKFLRESLSREPQGTAARRGPPQDARTNARPNPGNRPPQVRTGDKKGRGGAGPKEPPARRGMKSENNQTNDASAKGVKQMAPEKIQDQVRAYFQKLLKENPGKAEQLAEDYEPDPFPKYEPPTEITLDDLRGYGPSLPLGDWAASEMVNDHVRGGLVNLERERERIKMLAELYVDPELLARARSREEFVVLKDFVEKMQRGKGEELEEQGELLTEEQRGELVEGLLGGRYELGGAGEGEGKVVGGVRRMTGVNGSYLPKDGEKVVEKVKGLLPVQGVTKGAGKGARV